MSATHDDPRDDQRRQFGVLMALQDEQRRASGAQARARARYLRSLAEGVRPRAGVSLAWWLALPSLAVAGLVLWLAVRPAAITFAVDGKPGGRVGAVVTAGESPLPVRFGDGSEVELRADPRFGATMRVVELWRDGARVRLDSGRARVHVVPRQKTRWLFSAGPYEVRVVGTRFDLAWNPGAQSFAVTLGEGRVEVRGGSLPAPMAVLAGQTLQVDPRLGAPLWRLLDKSGAPSLDGAGAGPPALERGPAPSNPEPGRAEDHPQPDDPVSGRRRAPKEERSIWLELARAGKYGEALAAAQDDGFGQICAEATLPDLLTLAEAARFARNAGRSLQALKAVRARFADDPKAQVATFLLGRLTLEGRDYVEAERHFRDYLAENRRGPLAAEAHGRLLETLEDGGRREIARTEATRYLEQFPHGSYATLAKKILAR